MAFTVKLICGARTLNLNSGRYAVAAPFAPPSVALVPLMAGGTSANRWGGADRAGLGAVNRTYTFGLHIRGCASIGEVRAAASDLAYMLSLAGDPDAPLYLYYKPNSAVSADPLWGQDALYYEIAHADPPDLPPGGFYQMTRGKAYPNVRVTCDIKPFARGKTQAAGSATGGVFEDTLGTVDGQSRGVVVPRNTTNKMTNPVFGSATWDTGWTGDTSFTDEQNTDPEFVLFGRNSARLTSAAANRQWVQAINVGNTNPHTLSFYAKKPDGSAVTSTDVVVDYNTSAKTTTWTAVGNGWYRGVASFNGVASSVTAGCQVVTSLTTVYVDGFQLEEVTSLATPLAFGDLLGCAWTGTAHASTSTRTTGRLRFLRTDLGLQIGAGSIALVWRAPLSASGFTVDGYLFHTSDINFRLGFTGTGDKFTFTDGTTTLESAGQTFAAGDAVHLVVTWGTAGMSLYVNGALADSDNYAPATYTYLYLGSDDVPDDHCGGTFMDLRTYPVPLTAAEVLADYNNASPLMTDGQRVGAIPWLWTFDGDNIIDTLYDGTAWNAFVCGGVPGSAPAQTAVKVTGSAAISGARSWWLGVLPADIYIPLSNFFEEQTGTVSVGTTLGYTSKAITLPPYHFYRWMQGREWHLFAPCSTAGSGLSLAMSMVYTSGGVVAITNDAIGVVADGTNRTFWTRALVLRRLRHLYPTNPYFQVNYDVGISASHSGGTANLTIDKLFLVPRPLTRVDLQNTTSETIAHFSGPNAQITTTTGDVPEELAYVRGDEFELFPDSYNHVITVQGDPSGGYSATFTFTINQLLLLPRYALL
jgi:hypothetical protein